MDERQRLLPWFSLRSVPGVGCLLFKRLLDGFGSPEAVLTATVERLVQVDGINRKLAGAIAGHRMPAAASAALDRALEAGYRVVTMLDPAYPPLLREIPDPPAYLYVAGSLEGIDRCIAVVGSRNPTEYGLANTWELSRDLATRGFTVVSGMARGIDTAAHEGALDGGGRTVAVLGSGLDRIYPAENRRLFERITTSGAVVSEFSPKTGPDAHHFPARNRIISGMSLGAVIAEATLRSGSLITARLAADQGREVFAVPGSIHSFKSTGTHTLIKQGAKLVEHAGDVVDEILPMIGAEPEPPPSPAGAPPSPDLSESEAAICAALGPYPAHIDELGRRLELDPGRLSGLLLALELKGVVRQLPGKHFVLSQRSPDPT
ncbi:MAG: DNA-processing protein DprA [Desulfobacterales bacterium]|jgi:DNA processing protein